MITKRKPWVYIPTLYFAEGLPYTIVMMMSGVFFKSLGVSNEVIGHTSLLSLPWTLKFLWAPAVDFYASKRTWIIVAHLVLTLFVGALAALAFVSQSLTLNTFILICVGVLALIAVASATQDIAIDGYYLEVLTEEQKAFFVGVRNACYKIAWLVGSGALVYLAGSLGESVGLGRGWAAAFAMCSLFLLICFCFHCFYLPKVELRQVHTGSSGLGKEFWSAISSYFQQKGIVSIVIYIMLFRAGDALMLRQAPNFLLDPQSKGGMGLSVADVGIINGTVGMIALLLGGIVGSTLISRGGLRKWLWPTALIQNGAILFYWLLALTKPSIAWVYVVNSIEQFSYGLGTAAYTVFLLSTVSPRHKAAHYATATALMAFGLLGPQFISGDLWKMVGYTNFFLLSFMAAIPGIIAIFYLPIWRSDWKQTQTEDEPEESAESGISKAGQVGGESK